MPVFHCLFCSNEDLVFSNTSERSLARKYVEPAILGSLLPFLPLNCEVSHRLESHISANYDAGRVPAFVGLRT